VTDQFFTPSNIATSLLTGLTTTPLKVVADFAIGDGSLLRALPFKPKKSIGLDLDGNVINELRFSFPNWDLMNGNFLDPNETTKDWLRQWESKVDLVLLNPPFSCKGGTYLIVKLEDEEVRCRTALAFVVNALKYLKSDGILIAILPLSILKSEVDKKVISFLKEKWNIDFGTRLDRNSFVGCSPNSVVFTLSKKTDNYRLAYEDHSYKLDLSLNIKILRGSTQMHKTLKSGRYPVIHSTNIRNGELEKKELKYINTKTKYVQGTFLCIPRVGLPNKGKIVIISVHDEYILSDCLYGIKTSNATGLLSMKDAILNNWQTFQALYDSTCAPYVTLKQLEIFFHKFNVNTDIVSVFDHKME
jgi:hypothetical protein